ncbi:MAG TPA: SRPBCC domain-containing protein [Sphingomonadaceae bacterium]|nr:SRPBCC domain-containing protein [Sphingomonadaceae bacterium]
MSALKADLAISRLIKAPPAAVWKGWAEVEHFDRWWIPHPMECRSIKHDLRPGGGFETLMREPGGERRPHMEACFLEVVPSERLVFTTQLGEDWRPIGPWLSLTAIITLTPEDGGTRYAAQVMHRTPEEAAKHADLGFTDGWGTAIEQLGELVVER